VLIAVRINPVGAGEPPHFVRHYLAAMMRAEAGADDSAVADGGDGEAAHFHMEDRRLRLVMRTG